MKKLLMQTKHTKTIAVLTVILSVIVIITAATTSCAKSNDLTESQTHISHNDSVKETSLIMVPNLIGYSHEMLEYEFENLGLSPFLIVLVSDEPVDTVIFIERMEQSVPISTVIRVFVSGGLPEVMAETPIVTEPSTQPPDSTTESPSDLGESTEKHEIGNMRFGGIDWLVLDRDEDKLLLLSEFVLFDKVYNDEFKPVTWETSTIRSYLNNEFFYTFSTRDRERIAETTIINNDRMASLGFTYFGVNRWLVPAGNDTYDKIFLLSIEEVMKYFPNRPDRAVRWPKDDVVRPGGEWAWWLRSPGGDNFCAIRIVLGGVDLDLHVNDTHAGGIRPALWLYID
jgi:hypothetical protein